MVAYYQIVNVDMTFKQTVPSWSGFNKLLTPCVTVTTSSGYCPMINDSSTEYSTIYTVLKPAHKMVATVGKSD